MDMQLFTQPFPIARKLAVVAWLFLAAFLAWAATLPNEYLIYVRGITTPQPYPANAVLIEVVIAAVMLASMAWALAAASWQRVARVWGIALFTGVVGVSAALGAMHMPRHYSYFVLAMLLLAAINLIAGVVLTAVGLVARKASQAFQQDR